MWFSFLKGKSDPDPQTAHLNEQTYPYPCLTDCCLGPLTVGSPPPWTPCPDGVLPSEAACLPAAGPPVPGGWLAGLRPRSSDWVWAAALRWSLAWWSVLRAWVEGWLGLAGYESEAIDLLEEKWLVVSRKAGTMNLNTVLKTSFSPRLLQLQLNYFLYGFHSFITFLSVVFVSQLTN